MTECDKGQAEQNCGIVKGTGGGEGGEGGGWEGR